MTPIRGRLRALKSASRRYCLIQTRITAVNTSRSYPPGRISFARRQRLASETGRSSTWMRASLGYMSMRLVQTCQVRPSCRRVSLPGVLFAPTQLEQARVEGECQQLSLDQIGSSIVDVAKKRRMIFPSAVVVRLFSIRRDGPWKTGLRSKWSSSSPPN